MRSTIIRCEIGPGLVPSPIGKREEEREGEVEREGREGRKRGGLRGSVEDVCNIGGDVEHVAVEAVVATAVRRIVVVVWVVAVVVVVGAAIAWCRQGWS